MEYQTDDADFCISWLLGLQSERFIARCPRWAAEHQTNDPYFQVSYVLGLAPRPRTASTLSGGKSRAPKWAKEFESSDPNFLVSRLLGLIPSPTKSNRSKRRWKARNHGKSAVSEETAGSSDDDEDKSAQSNDLEESSDFGIAKLLGEEPYEVDDEDGEAEKEGSEDKASEEAPVLATADFLTLCQNLEEMLIDIE